MSQENYKVEVCINVNESGDISMIYIKKDTYMRKDFKEFIADKLYKAKVGNSIYTSSMSTSKQYPQGEVVIGVKGLKLTEDELLNLLQKAIVEYITSESNIVLDVLYGDDPTWKFPMDAYDKLLKDVTNKHSKCNCSSGGCNKANKDVSFSIFDDDVPEDAPDILKGCVSCPRSLRLALGESVFENLKAYGELYVDNILCEGTKKLDLEYIGDKVALLADQITALDAFIPECELCDVDCSYLDEDEDYE